jgi:hypothetical protein
MMGLLEHRMARRALILECEMKAEAMSSWGFLWGRCWWLEFASGIVSDLWRAKHYFGLVFINEADAMNKILSLRTFMT